MVAKPFRVLPALKPTRSRMLPTILLYPKPFHLTINRSQNLKDCCQQPFNSPEADCQPLNLPETDNCRRNADHDFEQGMVHIRLLPDEKKDFFSCVGVNVCV